MHSYYFECHHKNDHRLIIGSVMAASKEEAKTKIQNIVPNIEGFIKIRPEVPGELHGRAYIIKESHHKLA